MQTSANNEAYFCGSREGQEMLRMCCVCLLVGTYSGCRMRTVMLMDLPLCDFKKKVKASTSKDLPIK